MALVLIVPMAAILTYLLVQAWPVLSLAFLVENRKLHDGRRHLDAAGGDFLPGLDLADNPHDYMTAGGIWAPLVGTFWLVLDLAADRRAGGRAGRCLSQ